MEEGACSVDHCARCLSAKAARCCVAPVNKPPNLQPSMAVCVPQLQNPKLTAALPMALSRTLHSFQDPVSTGWSHREQQSSARRPTSSKLEAVKTQTIPTTCMTELSAPLPSPIQVAHAG